MKNTEAVRNLIVLVVDILSQSRHAFRSKQIERARKLLEEALALMDEDTGAA